MAKISIKSFINKANSPKLNTNPTVAGFLNKYREFLTSGELTNLTAPFISQVDAGELEPISALNSITDAVFNHMLALADANHGRVSKPKAKKRAPSVPKNYLAVAYYESGEIFKSDDFAFPQEAERACERWLIAAGPNAKGIVESTRMKDRHGNPLRTYISRTDAFASNYKKKRSPIMRGRPKSSGGLRFGVKTNPSYSHFSKG